MAEFIKWYLLYTSVCLAMAMLDAWSDGLPFETKPRLWQCAAAGLLLTLMDYWFYPVGSLKRRLAPQTKTVPIRDTVFPFAI